MTENDTPLKKLTRLTATVMCAAWISYAILYVIRMSEFDEDGYIFMALIVVTLAEVMFWLWAESKENGDGDHDGPRRAA